MNEASRAAAQRMLALAAAAAAASQAGCVAYTIVSAPVKVAADAVVVTGETASAAVKATGRVTVSVVNAAGRLGSDGVDASARLTEAGMITFVDAGTGAIIRVPWREGATLATAGADARLQLARRSIQVLRAGSVVLSSIHPVGATRLAAGDVIRIGG